MKKTNFLNELRKRKKVGLVECSEEVKASYILKAENCLKSAKILFENKLYENSTSEAYYSMYNVLLGLLFKVGIKCENHSGSIILFEKLFNEPELAEMISLAKKERIDKQYYVEINQRSKINEKLCKDMIENSEDFLVKMKTLISQINNEEINSLRLEFDNLFN